MYCYSDVFYIYLTNSTYITTTTTTMPVANSTLQTTQLRRGAAAVRKQWEVSTREDVFTAHTPVPFTRLLSCDTSRFAVDYVLYTRGRRVNA
jgi:hypothetical protein